MNYMIVKNEGIRERGYGKCGEHVQRALYTYGESKRVAQFEINIEINLVNVMAQIRLWLATTVYAIIEKHKTSLHSDSSVPLSFLKGGGEDKRG